MMVLTTGLIMWLHNPPSWRHYTCKTISESADEKPEGFSPHLWRSRKNPSSWYFRVSKLESQRCHCIPILKCAHQSTTDAWSGTAVNMEHFSLKLEPVRCVCCVCVVSREGMFTYAFVCTHPYLCAYVSVHVYACVCMCVCTYVCVHTSNPCDVSYCLQPVLT